MRGGNLSDPILVSGAGQGLGAFKARRQLLKAAGAALATAVSFVAYGADPESTVKPKPADANPKTACRKPEKGTRVMVRLHTNFGDIVLELDPEKAPGTVANFSQYVESGFYNNTVFHRVIDGFMIQGGGFEPGIKQKPTRASIQNEAANGLTNDAYTIAMARTSDPHSASSQFFINVKDNAFLNFSAPTLQGFGYCVFGKVVEGKDVVDKIKSVKTGDRGGFQNVPVEDVIIERAEMC
jgi:peptidyl-prolyl cis-trans isomerase B (cyclophilin B)